MALSTTLRLRFSHKIILLLFFPLSLLLGNTLVAQNTETVWRGGSILGSENFGVIGNWSNGLPEKGKDARIPSIPPSGIYPVIEQSSDNENNDEYVDYKLIIEEGASLTVEARLVLDACDINGNHCGVLENAGVLTVMPTGLMTIGVGASALNFQTGDISVRQKLSVIGTLENNGYISVRQGGELSNLGTIINYSTFIVSGTLALNGGSVDNKEGGRFTISQGAQGQINAGELLNTGGAFTCNGTILLNNNFDGLIKNESTFNIGVNGEIFIFPETEDGNGDKFLNHDEVINHGAIKIVGGDWINYSGANLVVNAGGEIIMNDTQESTLDNKAGASIQVDGDATDPGNIFVEAGFFANSGTLINNGGIVIRQLFINAGVFTNNSSLELAKNDRNASAVPVFNNSGTFLNAGAVSFREIISTAQINNSGTWRNEGRLTLGPSMPNVNLRFANEGYFDHESGNVEISSAGSFFNERCGRYRNNGTLTNTNRFFNNGHYHKDVNGVEAGNFPMQQEEYGFETFGPVVTANTTGLTRLHVFKFAQGNKDGSSWNDAITDLSAALQIAHCQGGIDEIFVSAASGGYFPSIREGASFHIPSNVQLIGGFNGRGSSIADANPGQYLTELDGFNANRVLRADGTLNSEINGFVINSGRANGTGEDGSGGGLYHSGAGVGASQLAVNNCVFRSNNSSEFGGAVYVKGGDGSSVITLFKNCVFYRNTSKWGGAINVDGSGPGSAFVELKHCTFYDNTATRGGADVRGFEGGLVAANSIFWGANTVSPILMASPTVDVVSHCIVEGGYTGENNLNQAPLFVDPDTHFNTNLRLQSNSPAIGAGIDIGVPTDLDGNPRAIDGPYDLGAYEFVNVLPIELIDFTARLVNQKKVELNWQTAGETNNDYFTIERSSDGLSFQPLAELAGAGSTDETQRYHHSDFSPLDGTSYYRLRQTDFDGQFTLSEIRRIERHASGTEATVFPNPIQDQINIRWGVAAEKERIIRVYDTMGRLINQREVANDTYTTSINTDDLRISRPGMYWLETQMDGRVQRMSFVKGR